MRRIVVNRGSREPRSSRPIAGLVSGIYGPKKNSVRPGLALTRLGDYCGTSLLSSIPHGMLWASSRAPTAAAGTATVMPEL